MKKVQQKKYLILLTSLLSIGLVSAETNAEILSKNIAQGISNLTKNIGLGQTNITTILLGILLWMILYSVVKKMKLFGEKGAWSGAIALIVTLLAMIVLKDNSTMLKMISGEYAAVGATILTVFPFLIALYFTTWVSDNLVVARAIWAVFGIYYFLTFAYSWGTSPATSAGFFDSWDNWTYLLGFIASIILFFFMPFIREKFWDIKIDSGEEKGKRKIDKANTALETLNYSYDTINEGE